MSTPIRDAENHSEHFGRNAATIEATLQQAESEKVIKRIWQRDAGVWKTDAAAQANIRAFVGWLDAVDFANRQLEEVLRFADEIKHQGFTHAVLCGMGGSSLCPEVLRRVFQTASSETKNGKQDTGLKLLVLDSTDPETVEAVKNQAPLATTLFIVASKSGTTVEPLSFYRFFYGQMQDFYASGQTSRCGTHAGDHFITITDDGTKMTRDATQDGFRKIFINPADIGGRYSALSLFGIVPAALMGLDVREMLSRAAQTVERCKDETTANHALRLGCAIGATAVRGADKLTLITDDRLASLGLWVEQLIAESTGKEGKGVVPVAGEPLVEVENYQADRVFVVVHVDDLSSAQEAKIKKLEAAQHTIVRRRLSDKLDLGAEFFVWEIATAVAGWCLQINPFDQPNVQAAKDITVKLLEDRKRSGDLPHRAPFAASDKFELYSPLDANSQDAADEAIIKHLKQARAGESYIALLAYLQESDEIDSLVSNLRGTLVERLNTATTFGYGPRYLHSTGQLHKGGAANGIFLVLTDEDKVDFDVPTTDYSFSILKQAQSLGDIGALHEAGRSVLRVHFKDTAKAGVSTLKSLIEKGL